MKVNITEQMLDKAFDKAVELGIIKKRGTIQNVLKNMSKLKQILEAALKDD